MAIGTYPRFILVITTMIFLFFVAGSYVDIQQGLISEDYESTTAEVIETEVKTIKDDDGLHSYRPEITYRYHVDGQTYTGDDYSVANEGYHNKTKVEEIVNDYPIGSNITIYYDPEYPEFSVIHNGVRQESIEDYRTYRMLYLAIALITLILFVPVVYRTYQKRQEISQIRDRDQLLVPSEFKFDQSNSTSSLSRFRNSQEIGTPRTERLVRFRQQIKDKVGVPALIAFIGFHQLVVLFVMWLDFKIPIELTAYTGISVSTLVLHIVSYTTLGIGLIGYIIMYATMDDDSMSFIGKLVLGIISYPFAALFGMMFLIIFPLIVGMFVMTGSFIYLGSLYILDMFSVSFTAEQNVAYLLFCIVIGIPIFTTIMNWYERTEERYEIISEGIDYTEFVYYNGEDEIYAIDGHSPITLGTRRGRIISIDQAENVILGKYRIHDAAITGVRLMDRFIVTASTDKTLRLLTKDRFTVTSMIETGKVIRVLQSFSDIVIAGYDDGVIETFLVDDQSMIRENKQKIFSKSIHTIEIIDNLVFVGGKNKYVKILELHTLEQVGEMKGQKARISDIWITKDEVIVSSFDGTVAVFDRFKFGLIDLYEIKHDPTLTSIIGIGHYIICGADDGKLYVIDRNKYELKKRENRSTKTVKGVTKYIIHELWIEDLRLFGNRLYSISSDGTMKIINLETDLEIASAPVDAARALRAMNPFDSDKTLELNCPICKDQFERGDVISSCNTCDSLYHQYHLEIYIDNKVEEGDEPSCVICQYSLF